MNAVRPYPRLGAFLCGYPAWCVATLLAEKMPNALEALTRRGTPEVAEVRAAWAAIQSAAEEYATWQRAATSDLGRSDPTNSDLPTSSEGEWLTTADAATRLGVTERQVRRLIGSGALAARRGGWAWDVSRSSVELHRQRAA